MEILKVCGERFVSRAIEEAAESYGVFYLFSDCLDVVGIELVTLERFGVKRIDFLFAYGAYLFREIADTPSVTATSRILSPKRQILSFEE